VTLQWITRRRWCSITTNTYNNRNVGPEETKKSQAMTPCARKRREVDQCKSRPSCPRGRRGRYLFTVRGDTRIPTLNSTSFGYTNGCGQNGGDAFLFALNLHPYRPINVDVLTKTANNLFRKLAFPVPALSATRVACKDGTPSVASVTAVTFTDSAK
jgi:hypothetical protein